MKLDLLNNQWIDIVFEGRNKSYGAYDLRKSITKGTTRAFLIGASLCVLVAFIPKIMSLIPEAEDDTVYDAKITAVKLPPKPKEKIPDNAPPPPPPPPKVDQVKFVKPVVAKADEVVEEIVEVKDIKDKNIGKETIKGDPDAELTVEPVGKGEVGAVVEEVDNTIYNAAGIEVKPEFPGGIQKFYDFIGKNFTVPEDAPSGKIYVNFTVEKDGSLTDIKVVRDIGFGSKEEALRVLKKGPRWTPAEQNGKKVRCSFTIPISIQQQE